MSKKVLSCIPLFDVRCARAVRLLEDNGYEIIRYQGDKVMTYDEIKEVGQDICGVIAGCEVWDEAAFQACPNLKAIGRFGVGVDCIDMEAAKRHGVKVCNARGMNCDSVGEATVMFVLACLRNLVELNNTTKEGGWVRYTGRTLKGKTYGLVGFGAIAKYVAKLLQSFDVGEILAYDVYHDEAAAKELNVRFVDFETLLKDSDIISIHIPCIPETVDLFSDREFDLMKESALLVNAARGPIVNQDALCRALAQGKIAGAATDVFTEEPTDADNPLFRFSNFICMPHQCADTVETFDAVAVFDAQVILDVMEGREPKNWLNP